MLGLPLIRPGMVDALTRTCEGLASMHSALRTGPLQRLFLLFLWALVGAESNNLWTSTALCSDKPTRSMWQSHVIGLCTDPSGYDGIGFTNVSLVLSTVGDEGLTLHPDHPASYTDAAHLTPVADLTCHTLSGDGCYLQPPDRPASLPAHFMMMLWWRWIKLSRQPLWYTKGVLQVVSTYWVGVSILLVGLYNVKALKRLLLLSIESMRRVVAWCLFSIRRLRNGILPALCERLGRAVQPPAKHMPHARARAVLPSITRALLFYCQLINFSLVWKFLMTSCSYVCITNAPLVAVLVAVSMAVTHACLENLLALCLHVGVSSQAFQVAASQLHWALSLTSTTTEPLPLPPLRNAHAFSALVGIAAFYCRSDIRQAMLPAMPLLNCDDGGRQFLTAFQGITFAATGSRLPYTFDATLETCINAVWETSQAASSSFVEANESFAKQSSAEYSFSAHHCSECACGFCVNRELIAQKDLQATKLLPPYVGICCVLSSLAPHDGRAIALAPAWVSSMHYLPEGSYVTFANLLRINILITLPCGERVLAPYSGQPCYPPLFVRVNAAAALGIAHALCDTAWDHELVTRHLRESDSQWSIGVDRSAANALLEKLPDCGLPFYHAAAYESAVEWILQCRKIADAPPTVHASLSHRAVRTSRMIVSKPLAPPPLPKALADIDRHVDRWQTLCLHPTHRVIVRKDSQLIVLPRRAVPLFVISAALTYRCIQKNVAVAFDTISPIVHTYFDGVINRLGSVSSNDVGTLLRALHSVPLLLLYLPIAYDLACEALSSETIHAIYPATWVRLPYNTCVDRIFNTSDVIPRRIAFNDAKAVLPKETWVRFLEGIAHRSFCEYVCTDAQVKENDASYYIHFRCFRHGHARAAPPLSPGDFPSESMSPPLPTGCAVTLTVLWPASPIVTHVLFWTNGEHNHNPDDDERHFGLHPFLRRHAEQLWQAGSRGQALVHAMRHFSRELHDSHLNRMQSFCSGDAVDPVVMSLPSSYTIASPPRGMRDADARHGRKKDLSAANIASAYDSTALAVLLSPEETDESLPLDLFSLVPLPHNDEARCMTESAWARQLRFLSLVTERLDAMRPSTGAAGSNPCVVSAAAVRADAQLLRIRVTEYNYYFSEQDADSIAAALGINGCNTAMSGAVVLSTMSAIERAKWGKSSVRLSPQDASLVIGYIVSVFPPAARDFLRTRPDTSLCISMDGTHCTVSSGDVVFTWVGTDPHSALTIPLFFAYYASSSLQTDPTHALAFAWLDFFRSVGVPRSILMDHADFQWNGMLLALQSLLTERLLPGARFQVFMAQLAQPSSPSTMHTARAEQVLRSLTSSCLPPTLPVADVSNVRGSVFNEYAYASWGGDTVIALQTILSSRLLIAVPLLQNAKTYADWERAAAPLRVFESLLLDDVRHTLSFFFLHSRLCSWHISNNWTQNIWRTARKKNKEHINSILSQLHSLFQEQSMSAFHKRTADFFALWDTQEPAFCQYLRVYWFNDRWIDLWPMANRHFARGFMTATSRSESMHQLYKASSYTRETLPKVMAHFHGVPASLVTTAHVPPPLSILQQILANAHDVSLGRRRRRAPEATLDLREQLQGFKATVGNDFVRSAPLVGCFFVWDGPRTSRPLPISYNVAQAAMRIDRPSARGYIIPSCSGEKPVLDDVFRQAVQASAQRDPHSGDHRYEAPGLPLGCTFCTSHSDPALWVLENWVNVIDEYMMYLGSAEACVLEGEWLFVNSLLRTCTCSQGIAARETGYASCIHLHACLARARVLDCPYTSISGNVDFALIVGPAALRLFASPSQACIPLPSLTSPLWSPTSGKINRDHERKRQQLLTAALFVPSMVDTRVKALAARIRADRSDEGSDLHGVLTQLLQLMSDMDLKSCPIGASLAKRPRQAGARAARVHSSVQKEQSRHRAMPVFSPSESQPGAPARKRKERIEDNFERLLDACEFPASTAVLLTIMQAYTSSTNESVTLEANAARELANTPKLACPCKMPQSICGPGLLIDDPLMQCDRCKGHFHEPCVGLQDAPRRGRPFQWECNSCTHKSRSTPDEESLCALWKKLLCIEKSKRAGRAVTRTTVEFNMGPSILTLPIEDLIIDRSNPFGQWSLSAGALVRGQIHKSTKSAALDAALDLQGNDEEQDSCDDMNLSPAPAVPSLSEAAAESAAESLPASSLSNASPAHLSSRQTSSPAGISLLSRAAINLSTLLTAALTVVTPLMTPARPAPIKPPPLVAVTPSALVLPQSIRGIALQRGVPHKNSVYKVRGFKQPSPARHLHDPVIAPNKPPLLPQVGEPTAAINAGIAFAARRSTGRGQRGRGQRAVAGAGTVSGNGVNSGAGVECGIFGASIGATPAIRHEARGLVNPGNTCFINVNLQMLYHIPALRQILFSYPVLFRAPTSLPLIPALNFPGDAVLHQRLEATGYGALSSASDIIIAGLQTLFIDMSHAASVAVCTRRVNTGFGLTAALESMQHDANEGFDNILDKVLEALPTATRNELNDLFSYTLSDIVYPPNQRDQHYSQITRSGIEPVYVDVLGGRQATTLLHELRVLFSPTTVENYCICQRSQGGCICTRVTCHKTTSFQTLPSILQVALKRIVHNANNNTTAKYNRAIGIPLQVDAAEFMSLPTVSAPSTTYCLHSIVVHEGRSSISGHYVIFIRVSMDDTWLELNDAQRPTQRTWAHVQDASQGAQRNAVRALYVRSDRLSAICPAVVVPDSAKTLYAAMNTRMLAHKFPIENAARRLWSVNDSRFNVRSWRNTPSLAPGCASGSIVELSDSDGDSELQPHNNTELWHFVWKASLPWEASVSAAAKARSLPITPAQAAAFENIVRVTPGICNNMEEVPGTKKRLKLAVELTRGDLRTLLPGRLLNDEIINAFMHFLQERDDAMVMAANAASPQLNLARSWVTNTFMYAKLTGTVAGISPQNKGTYDFARICRWCGYKKGRRPLPSFFDRRILVIPIHESLIHWLLAAVYIDTRQIIIVDSIRSYQTEAQHAKNILRFLKDCWDADAASTTLPPLLRGPFPDNWKVIFGGSQAQQQRRGGNDCGVHTLSNTEQFLFGLHQLQDMTHYRQYISKILLGS